MSRLAPMLILAAVLAGCAQQAVHNPIPAGASRDDVAFLNAMSEHRISNEDGSQAQIDLAHQMCGLLGAGMTVDGLSKHFSLSHKNLSPDEMRWFIETSAASYCPQYLR
jgi:hypothetical protein